MRHKVNYGVRDDAVPVTPTDNVIAALCNVEDRLVEIVEALKALDRLVRAEKK